MNIMGSITDNPFAHRLGWALIHSLWEGALGAGVFALLRLGLRRRSANVRYAASCIMLALLAATPAITFLYLRSFALPGPIREVTASISRNAAATSAPAGGGGYGY